MPRSSNKPVVNTRSSVPSTVTVQTVQSPSLFSSMKQGFGFGVGSSIAHNIFDSRPVQTNPDYKIVYNKTADNKTAEFKQCMEKTYNNYDECVKHLNT
jgi:hypothetical protein